MICNILILVMSIFLSFVLTSILSQFIVYKNIIANTEENRKLIQSLFDNPQNEYVDNIFHILDPNQRKVVQYITKIKLLSYYIKGLGWIPKFLPLGKFVDKLYKEAKMKTFYNN